MPLEILEHLVLEEYNLGMLSPYFSLQSFNPDKASDAFTKREAASETKFIREKEMERFDPISSCPVCLW